MKINEVFIKPILTEKTTKLAGQSVYSFEVQKSADKHKIKKAVEFLYSVKVDEIKIVNRKGKIRKVGRKMKSKKYPNKKIAYIRVKSGKIDFFPQT